MKDSAPNKVEKNQGRPQVSTCIHRACTCTCRRNIAFVFECTRIGESTAAVFPVKAFFLCTSLCLIQTCEATFAVKYSFGPAQETVAQQRLKGGSGQLSESNLYTPAFQSPPPEPHPTLGPGHTRPLSSPMTTLHCLYCLLILRLPHL